MRGRSIPPPLAILRVIAHLAVLVFAAYAVSRVFEVTSTDKLNFLIWLVAGAILHDSLLLPVYAIGDMLARLGLSEVEQRRVPAAGNLRFPAAVSGVLLLVYLPSIIGRNDGTFDRLSGRPPAVDPLEAWLWITVAVFALSALVYAVRVARAPAA